MKDKDYNRQIRLRCVICGDDSSFESNEDNSYIKCIKCGREYHGGYDEVVELNQELVNNEVENMKEEVVKDVHKMFKDAFKGNKNIRFK